MNRRYVLPLLWLFTVAGCREILPPPSVSADGSQATPVFLFDDLTTIMIFDDLVRVTGITVEGDHLTLNVLYSGGCKTHDFRMYANRAFIGLSPPQAELFLSHDGQNDECGLTISNILTFDLRPLQGALRQSGDTSNVMLLRIHEPGSSSPLLPLTRYHF